MTDPYCDCGAPYPTHVFCETCWEKREAEIERLRAEIACAADLMNTWARELNVQECTDPWSGQSLRDLADRLWSRSTHKAEGAPMKSPLPAELKPEQVPEPREPLLNKRKVTESRDNSNPMSFHYALCRDWLVFQAENKRLEAERWKCDSCGCEFPAAFGDRGVTQCSKCVEAEQLRLALREARATIAQLPKTADGVPVVPGMVLWGHGWMRDGCEITAVRAGGQYNHLYSTREAAEAAEEA